MYGDLVSVIMPAYNCADFIGRSIESVMNQTYQNWELIIVDDCSSDETALVIQTYAKKDSRIKYHKLKKNSGAAVARNTAVDLAQGTYLAFNDSDDIWKPEKLEKQIRFMEEHHYAFTCTDYGKIDENDTVSDVVVKCAKIYDYDLILKRNFGNSTVIYNCKKLGKFHAANIRKRNDFVMWLAVIKKAKYVHGMPEMLSYHRVHSGSISYKKSDLMKYQWQVYRKIEHLSFFKCCYLMAYKVVDTLKLKTTVSMSNKTMIQKNESAREKEYHKL